MFFVLTVMGAAYLLWIGGRAYYFYNGASEKWLSETGIDFEKAAANQLGDTWLYAPQYPFWSDGAEKHRFLHLPAGSQIDNSNPDRWNFPEGARLWKVFYRDGVLVETRMLYKFGSDPWQWDMSVYQPQKDGTDSVKLAFGKSNVSDTPHDIPRPAECVTCHSSGKQRRPLGLTAIQLPWAHETELSFETLIEEGLLTDPPAAAYKIPGDALTKAALRYLDTNCGSCHYEGSTFVTKDVPLAMNLTTATLSSVSATNTVRTAVSHAPHITGLGTDYYIVPGDPHQSFVWRRMSLRDGGGWQMPPLATEMVDKDGVRLIEEWIKSLDDEEASGQEGDGEQ